MPAQRKLTWEEQAKNLELRATECKQKAQRKFINAVLDKNPQVLNEIVAKIQALGFTEETVTQSPGAKSLQRAAVDKRKNTSSKLAIRDEGPPILVTPYHRMDACSVNFLIDSILSHCEPNAMSQPNLKRHTARGKALQNRELLLELVEFSTGLLPDTPLSGKLATVGGLKEYCLMRHQARGRRTRDLSLPPVWEEAGIYSLELLGDNIVMVRERFSCVQVQINVDTTPALRGVDDLTIVYNFSESRAALASTKDLDKFVLLHPLVRPTVDAMIDLKDAVLTPPTKKQRLSLEDGLVASAPSGSMNDLTDRPTVNVGGIDPALGAIGSAPDHAAGGIDPALEASEQQEEQSLFDEDDAETKLETATAADGGSEEAEMTATTDNTARALTFSEAALEVPAPADEADDKEAM